MLNVVRLHFRQDVITQFLAKLPNYIETKYSHNKQFLFPSLELSSWCFITVNLSSIIYSMSDSMGARFPEF
jgi:hypothetical protein